MNRTKNALIFVAGMLAGAIAPVAMLIKKPIGNLRIDESDPSDEAYLFLELNKGVGDIRKKKRVMLNVVDKNYVPRK